MKVKTTYVWEFDSDDPAFIQNAKDSIKLEWGDGVRLIDVEEVEL